MCNSGLFNIVKELEDGFLEPSNPIVKAVCDVHYEAIIFEIDIWQDKGGTDEAFVEQFAEAFPPGFVRRDLARAKQVLFALRDIARSEEIRHELAPIYTYVMYDFISFQNELMDDMDQMPKDLPVEVKEYLREKNIRPRSEKYQFIKSWFTDSETMLSDFANTYDEDFTDDGFAEAIATIYLDSQNAKEKLELLGVSIEDFFDLLPDDLLERVQKKYQKGQANGPIQIYDGVGNNRCLPQVFISYSWDDESHKEWVASFASTLMANGIMVIMDDKDTLFGDRLTHFMEASIAESDYVLIICTPNYKAKADNRCGGVGYEGQIISAELLKGDNERKFIPVLRQGTDDTAVPRFLAGKRWVDFRSEKDFDKNLSTLVSVLQDGRR